MATAVRLPEVLAKLLKNPPLEGVGVVVVPITGGNSGAIWHAVETIIVPE
jgi:hypothetical protein